MTITDYLKKQYPNHDGHTLRGRTTVGRIRLSDKLLVCQCGGVLTIDGEEAEEQKIDLSFIDLLPAVAPPRFNISDLRQTHLSDALSTAGDGSLLRLHKLLLEEWLPQVLDYARHGAAMAPSAPTVFRISDSDRFLLVVPSNLVYQSGRASNVVNLLEPGIANLVNAYYVVPTPKLQAIAAPNLAAALQADNDTRLRLRETIAELCYLNGRHESFAAIEWHGLSKEQKDLYYKQADGIMVHNEVLTHLARLYQAEHTLELVEAVVPGLSREQETELRIEQLARVVHEHCRSIDVRGVLDRCSEVPWDRLGLKDQKVIRDEAREMYSDIQRPVGQGLREEEPEVAWGAFPTDEAIQAQRKWWRRRGKNVKPHLVELEIRNGDLIDDTGDSPPIVLRSKDGKTTAASFPQYLKSEWRPAVS